VGPHALGLVMSKLEPELKDAFRAMADRLERDYSDPFKA